MLVPEKPPAKVGSRGFHRPSRHSTSSYKTVKSGKHLKLKPPGSRTTRHTAPASLPRRALSRLGLKAQHFESWQVQAVDGDILAVRDDADIAFAEKFRKPLLRFDAARFG